MTGALALPSPTGAGARRNLVVVRAGQASLHPHWLDAGQKRNWDLVVSLYDPAARFEHDPDISVVLRPGGKWDGLHAFLTQSDVASRYDYIWLPDDDILAGSADIDAIFDAMRIHDLDIAQPSLTRDSYFTHFVLMSCPGFELRFANFIEIMVPCLKAGLLAAVLDDLSHSMSGFGLDDIWCHLSENPLYKAAILDRIAVRHTRPVGKALRGRTAGQKRFARDEEAILRARYNIPGRIRPLVYAPIDTSGRLRRGCMRLGLAMAARYLSVYREFTVQESASWKILQLIRRQALGKPDLRSLKRSSKPVAVAPDRSTTTC